MLFPQTSLQDVAERGPACFHHVMKVHKVPALAGLHFPHSRHPIIWRQLHLRQLLRPAEEYVPAMGRNSITVLWAQCREVRHSALAGSARGLIKRVRVLEAS